MYNALIIDDDNMIFSPLKDVLEKMGYIDIYAFSETEKIIEFLKDEKSNIGLIVVDYYLTTISGAELIKRIRKIKPHVRIVTISGDKSKLQECFKAGCNYFLTKPFGRRELEVAIGRKYC